MKHLFLTAISFLLITIGSGQQISIGGGQSSPTPKGLSIGSAVPNIEFKDLLNAPAEKISMSALEGKVVLLEFWATWCGPCLPAIKHLDELKKAFPGKLEVLAISSETPERIQRFIKNRPSSLWFMTDTKDEMMQYFPYHSIPHIIVIDTKGQIAAITSPDEVTEKVVRKLLNGNEISLKEKNDGTEPFDFTKDYFPKPEGFDGYSFEVQPAIPGGFPITRRSTPQMEWYGRRVTMLNNPINILYTVAYDMPISKVVYDGVQKEDFDHRKTKLLYCIDVIVPKGKEDELKKYMRQQLEQLDLEFGARLEKRKIESVVFTCEDPSKMKRHINTSNNGDASNVPRIIRANSYSKKNAPIDELFLHFSNFGIIKQPIVNETGLTALYDLQFEFDIEDADSFKKELKRLGLKTEKQEREVEVLVVYKK